MLQRSFERPETASETGTKQPDTTKARPSQHFFKDTFGNSSPKQSLESLAREPKQQKINASQEKRHTAYMKAVDWAEKTYHNAIPDNIRGYVDFALGLIPGVSGLCEAVKGQAMQQEALAGGLSALKKRDFEAVKGQFGNWFKGIGHDTWGRIQIAADILTLGGDRVVIEGVEAGIKGLSGAKLVEKAGPSLIKASEKVASTSPQAGKFMERTGNWLRSQVTTHPEIATQLGSFIDSSIKPGKEAVSQIILQSRLRKEAFSPT